MTARIGAPKTGGRRRGSLDRGERQLVTAEMAGDILAVYKKLGGAKWLLKFAQDNPVEFLRQGLSKLFPAAPKDDEPGSTYNQFNIGNLSEQQVAARVAFALARGLHDDPSVVIEHAPTPAAEIAQQEEVTRWPPWTPPRDMPDMPDPSLEPEPVEDPDRQRWASEIPLTPEQRRDNAMIRETYESSITDYQGGAGEQGGHGSTRSPAQTVDPRAAQRDRMLRRKELL